MAWFSRLKPTRSQSSIDDRVPADIDITKLVRWRRQIINRGSRYRLAIITTPRRIIVRSLLLSLFLSLVFIFYLIVRVYHYQHHSAFIYTVTRWLPLPIAAVDGDWVTYHDYLTELRRYIYYFETQQGYDFSQPTTKQILTDIKQRSLQRVVDQAYIDKLAHQHQLTVTDHEAQAVVESRQQQNSLGHQRKIEAVLDNYFDLTYAQYLDRLKDELLKQKVIAQLDNNQAQTRAQAVLAQARLGANFALLARDNSDDTITADNGGEYSFLLDLDQQNEHPAVLATAFELEVNQISDIIEADYRLEIIKVLDDNGYGQRRVAHISFYFINQHQALATIKAQYPATYYLELN